MTVGIVDGDWLAYAASFVGEARTIKVTKKDNGKTFECKNRTEFWGGKRKEIGGKLALINAKLIEKGKEPYTKEDFLIEDVQTLKEPLPYILHTVKVMLDSALKTTGCTKKEVYLGRGESFRVGRSTVWKYKGNRDNVLRPLLKADVTDYLVRQHAAQIVEDIEADDKIIMQAYGTDNVVISHDKDALGSPVFSFNPQKPELGIQNGNEFGRLYLNDRGEVKGHGRLFFYFQVGYGDDVDNYKANSGNPAIKWGEKSAYDTLADCKTDKQALQALVNIYQYLYPSRTEIGGWRGNRIEIDASYMLNENWDMARMLRFDGDSLTADEVLEKFKVKF